MSKGGINYQSRAGEVKYVMNELERAALKATAKLLRPIIKQNTPKAKGKAGGTLRKNVGTWVKKKDASLQIGIYTRARAQRKKYKYAYHAHLVHFGTEKTRARPFLRDPVYQNIDLIRITQGKFLKEIEDENRARGLIQEEEEIEDD